jgi:hypothetical protein
MLNIGKCAIVYNNEDSLEDLFLILSTLLLQQKEVRGFTAVPVRLA